MTTNTPIGEPPSTSAPAPFVDNCYPTGPWYPHYPTYDYNYSTPRVTKKTTTTSKKYDDAGKMFEEITVEEVEYSPAYDFTWTSGNTNILEC